MCTLSGVVLSTRLYLICIFIWHVIKVDVSFSIHAVLPLRSCVIFQILAACSYNIKMFFLAPFCGPQSDWGFYSCQSKLGRWTHSVVKWRTHFYNISKCSFYFQRDVSITEMDGTDRTSRHSTTSNTNTCTPLLQNQMQLLGAHALQQSGVKHIIVWRQAKESAAFSLEWNIQSPLPKLWHIYGLTFRKRSPSDKNKNKKNKKSCFLFIGNASQQDRNLTAAPVGGVFADVSPLAFQFKLEQQKSSACPERGAHPGTARF